MRTLRTLGLFLAVLAAASAARADDTKPPNISDVKAATKGSSVAIEAKITDDTGVLSAVCFHRKPGGKWEEARMAKNEYDDVFKTSFPGGGDTEYYIQATDLLGNGPSSYGAQAKPMALGGGGGGGGGRTKKPAPEAVAQNDPPPPPPEPPPAPEPKPKREPRPPPEPKPKRERPPPVASASKAAPVITHRKPGASPLEGQDFTLRVNIQAEAGVATAAVYAKPAGGEKAVTIPLTAKGSEGLYVAVIPSALAHGTIEYLFAAKDGINQQSNQGDGGPDTWFKLEFKGASKGASDPGLFTVASGAVSRTEPRKPIVLRAQVSPGGLEGMNDEQATASEATIKGLTVSLLWREKDGEDQLTPMNPDPSGGLGGYGVSLEPQFDGTVIYYQVVACTADGKCAIDTGSKRKWNPLTVSSAPADAPPPLEAVNKKAPAGTPD